MESNDGRLGESLNVAEVLYQISDRWPRRFTHLACQAPDLGPTFPAR
jgi:hypothetical protein